MEALRRLRLHAVWWLVSPQNPLKSTTETAPFAARLAQARTLAADPRIVVTELEAALGTRYTADTLGQILTRFPRTRFIWLMGADNMIQVHRWKDWREIFNSLPVAIFDRPSYSLGALSAKAARRFASQRLPEARAGRLAEETPPAWVFIHHRVNTASSTGIRAARRAGRPRPTR